MFMYRTRKNSLYCCLQSPVQHGIIAGQKRIHEWNSAVLGLCSQKNIYDGGCRLCVRKGTYKASEMNSKRVGNSSGW
uniref:Uncharacterized protein n=1 Tax=Anguilla anguilla TaxID=7936 RepID=A0A0E9SAT8_ANGAN